MFDRFDTENYVSFEMAVNEAMRNVTLEIHSVDLIDLASFIHTENFANLADIISSASELYFKPDALMFSYSADVKLDWFGCPMVSLDLELHESNIDIFFSLKIDAFSSYIKFKHAAFNEKPLRAHDDMQAFQSALEKAKLVRHIVQTDAPEWTQVFKPAVENLKLISFR